MSSRFYAQYHQPTNDQIELNYMIVLLSSFLIHLYYRVEVKLELAHMDKRN